MSAQTPAVALPESILAIPDGVLKKRAEEAWRAANDLTDALFKWHLWFGELWTKGDADPALALSFDSRARIAIHVLCHGGLCNPTFRPEAVDFLCHQLPPLPDWRVAGPDYQWDEAQGKIIEVAHPGWQKDRAFLDRYYGAENLMRHSRDLCGIAAWVEALLTTAPITTLRTHAASTMALPPYHARSPEGDADAPAASWEMSAHEPPPDGQPPRKPGPKLKQPSDAACDVYRYHFATGMSQTDLARDSGLRALVGRSYVQGTICRMLKQVKKWIEAGNIVPNLPSAPRPKTIVIDPSKIDYLERQDD